MKLPRDITARLVWALDNLLPPALRDARWFARLFIAPVARQRTRAYLDFKARAPGMSAHDYADAYRETAGVMDRETDLNRPCAERIEVALTGGAVLDVGAGRGWLAARLSERCAVTALDIVTPEARGDGFSWVQGRFEALPFADDSFDGVVCAHVLEHVLDFEACLAELRRVTRGRLIIVVPLQRPYRHALDLHLNFFPWPEAFLLRARPGGRAHAWSVLGGDLYYEEDAAKAQ